MERLLPRGRHGLSREFVAQNQPERLFAALAYCLHEVDYDQTTVSTIGKRASVSKSDFYKQFKSKDACFLTAYDDAVERVREQVIAACGEGGDWPARVLAALASLLSSRVLAGKTDSAGGLPAGRCGVCAHAYLGAADARRIISER